jgi:cytidine deaminase
MAYEEITFRMEILQNIDELTTEDAFLLKEARVATEMAYAPYSNFRVGAVARLVNGEIVTGSNQENAAFPAGICAERTVLSVASSLYPGVGIDTIAVSYHNMNGASNQPISPCGICRQSLSEFQQRTQAPIRVILSGMEGVVQIIPNVNDLLPLQFSASDMNKTAKIHS